MQLSKRMGSSLLPSGNIGLRSARLFVCFLASQQTGLQSNSEYTHACSQSEVRLFVCLYSQTQHSGEIPLISEVQQRSVRGEKKNHPSHGRAPAGGKKCSDTKLKRCLGLDWLLWQTRACHKTATDVALKSINFGGILHFKWITLCKWVADLPRIQEEREDNPLRRSFSLHSLPLFTLSCASSGGIRGFSEGLPCDVTNTRAGVMHVWTRTHSLKECLIMTV